ncbi:hypothetical protein WJX81_000526 [Elliptochloris bilobata]|uniref:protein-serine/threonine phosphatase n=1 Tax=Elliptochloris bilobata TaxID=381761 RepID=A0AAW1QV59_9CHLO
MRLLRGSYLSSSAAFCRCWSANGPAPPRLPPRPLAWQQRQERGARSRRGAPLSAATDTKEAVFQTIDEGEWDEKYAGKFGTLPYGVAMKQGPRPEMEDFTHIIPRARCGFLFAAVFDGHGGVSAGQYLCKQLYLVLSDAIDEETYGEECSLEERDVTGLCCPVELSTVLSASFERTDKDLLLHLENGVEGEESNSGATATVALVRRDKIVVANVGDSRAVVSRRGQAVDLSTEHRVWGAGETVDAETARVQAAGGWVADGRVCDVLAVSRAFGDREFKGAGLHRMMARGVEEQWWDQGFADSIHFTADPVVARPDVIEAAVNEGDEFLILASDGLWDVMSSRDAVTYARADFQRGCAASEVAEKLAKLAIKRHTADNVTVVVVDLGGGKDGWQAHKGKGKGGGGMSGGWNPFSN